MTEWIKITGTESLPKKPGLCDYEQIDCLIYHQGIVMHSVWNCEHICWDDSSGDDHMFEPLEPSHYSIITYPEKEKNDN